MNTPNPLNRGVRRFCLPLVICGLLFTCWPMAAKAGILWFNTASNRITYSDGTTPLAGDRTDSALGCLLQLICAGNDTLINAANLLDDGTTGDDAVIATAWMGKGVFSSDRDGWLVNGVPAAGIQDYWYYVRVWAAPAADYALGQVPNASYGDSILWQYPGDGDPPADSVFNFGQAAGFATMLVPVPEPATGVLMLAGLAGLWQTLKRRQPRPATPPVHPYR